jgi:hypothetical protein
MRSDGTVLRIADSSPLTNATVIPGFDRIVSIAASQSDCLALRDDGSVVLWESYRGVLTNNAPAGVSNVVAIGSDGTLRLAAMAVDQPPLTYRWQLDGVDIDGGTGSVLVISNAAAGS